MLQESYQTSAIQTSHSEAVQDRIEQLLAHLEHGTADRGYVALQLAKYAAQEPALLPTVRQLAAEFDPATRAQILRRLPASPPMPQKPTRTISAASAREEAVHIWQEIGDRKTALLLIARLVRYDPTLTDDVRVLARTSLVYDQDRRAILAEVDRHMPPDPAEHSLSKLLILLTPEFEGVRIDPEIGRLAIGLNLAAQHRIWALARHAGAGGWIGREDLEQQLAALDIAYNTRYLRRLLRHGDGLFWGLACRGRKIFFRSAAKVGAALVRRAKQANRHELYTTNLPGGRDVWLPILPDLIDWEAGIYGAWFAWRNNPEIARETIAMLFGRSVSACRLWEERLGERLSVRPNVAQSTCDDPAQLPPHAVQYMNWSKERRYCWRLPNTYIAAFRVHHHKGSARKRRELAGYEAFGQPVEDDMARTPPAKRWKGWWFDRSHRSERRYHSRAGKLMSMIRRDARLKYPSGIRKRVHFVWRGLNRLERGVFEYVPREPPHDEISPDWVPKTRADERLPIRMEYATMGDYKRYERMYLQFLQAQGEIG